MHIDKVSNEKKTINTLIEINQLAIVSLIFIQCKNKIPDHHKH
ncbi:hypothetical protein VCHA37P191_60166 [Vibrio chagasii]|nr:hypothetical protein VCHA37P191_60166 [Vibrio chagasii]